jgi:hypothetical protein
MKKFLFAVAMALMIFVPVQICAATDIWVTHWENSNVDIYVVEDTLKNISADDNRVFSVSVKEVRGGQLLKNIQWTFIKFAEEFWRYQTDDMDGEHLTVVTPRNDIFEFCMEKLNWAYKIEDLWYY